MIFIHAADQPINSLTFSPDGMTLAAAGPGGALRLWDAAAGTVRHVVNNEGGSGFQRTAFLPDGSGLLACRPEGVWHWDFAARTMREEPVALNPSSDMALTPDGLRVMLTHVGEPESFQCRPWRGDHVSWRRSYTDLDPTNLGHATRGFQPVAVSGNGRLAATAGYDARTYVWDAETGGLVARSEPLSHPATRIAFSVDGRSIAVCARRQLSVWYFFQMTELLRKTVDKPAFTAVKFDPSGRLLAASCDDDTVRFWDTRHWQEMQRFTWDLGGINDVTFSPDGLRAACAGDSGKIVIWDVDL